MKRDDFTIRLIDLLVHLPIEIPAGEQWAIAGAEAEAFRREFTPAVPRLEETQLSQLDGLILAGALSGAAPEASAAWLDGTAAALKPGAALLVVEWQADGPPQPGPDMGRRFKKGRLCRLLRQAGFGQIETLIHQPLVYVVKAAKVPPPPAETRFEPVAALDALKKNEMKLVELAGQQVVVANTGREIVAFARACPHAGAPLEQGLLRGRNLACPRHGYIWNVRSGQPVLPDDEDVLACHAVKIDKERNQILVAPKLLRPKP